MAYIALRDFDQFKKGDSIPAEFVQDRLIRGKKIGLVEGSTLVVSEIPEVQETKEIKEELITEVVEVPEKEEVLLEDSSDVSVEIKEETKVSKESKK